MRNAFADEITNLGLENDKIVLLTGDIGNRLFDDFKDRYFSRFFNCGIAEANMMSVASGLGMSGFRPIVYTITPFVTTRCLEQIKIGVCYHDSPVIIVGTGSGLSYAQLGPTHHSSEDIAILRALPNIRLFSPSGPKEMRLGLRQALKETTPVYIRLGKKGEPNLYDEGLFDFSLGKSIPVKKGSDICIISSGPILGEVIKAAEILEASGISTQVENFHTIKPLDHISLKKIFSSFSVVAIVEEHFKIGGLFGAIAEWSTLNCSKMPKILNFGIDDTFMHEVGSQSNARKKFGLTSKNISAGVLSAVSEVKSH